jgi:hypothetical protein
MNSAVFFLSVLSCPSKPAVLNHHILAMAFLTNVKQDCHSLVRPPPCSEGTKGSIQRSAIVLSMFYSLPFVDVLKFTAKDAFEEVTGTNRSDAVGPESGGESRRIETNRGTMAFLLTNQICLHSLNCRNASQIFLLRISFCFLGRLSVFTCSFRLALSALRSGVDVSKGNLGNVKLAADQSL